MSIFVQFPFRRNYRGEMDLDFTDEGGELQFSFRDPLESIFARNPATSARALIPRQ